MTFLVHGQKYSLAYLRALLLMYYFLIYGIVNNVDDNTLYSVDNNKQNITIGLGEASNISSNWFIDN